MPKVAKAKKTQQWIQNALEDAKTQNIAVLDVRKISDFTDYMVIATRNLEPARAVQRRQGRGNIAWSWRAARGHRRQATR